MQPACPTDCLSEQGGSCNLHHCARRLAAPPSRWQARAALLTSAQCATYDELKLFFVRGLGWEDNLQTHFAVSALAGLVTTTVTAPVDMVKTVSDCGWVGGTVDCR